MQMDLLCLICHHDFFDASVDMCFIIRKTIPHCGFFLTVNIQVTLSFRTEFFSGFLHGQIEVTHDHVLTRCNDRLTVFRTQDVVGTKHHDQCFGTRFLAQRNVNGHLVTVEVGVECRTYQRVQTHRTSFDQFRNKCLDTQTVQGRCTVHQDWISVNDRFHDIPDARILTIDQFFRSLRV